MEISDLLVITKDDGDLKTKARLTQAEYISALKYMRPRNPVWKPKVMRSSIRDPKSIHDVSDCMFEFWDTLLSSGELEERRTKQMTMWMWDHVREELLNVFQKHPRIVPLAPALEEEWLNKMATTTSTTRFAADYAKRVAGCKKCKMQLAKGEIRLAKIIPNPFVQKPDGGPPPDMKQYYHPHCLFEMFFKARANTKVVESSDDIEDDYDGDMLTLVRLLLPGVDQRVYNVKEKQLIKHFASIFDLPAEDLLNEYKNSGDVSQTIRDAMERNNLSRVQKGNWSIEKVDRWLNKLTEFTKDDEQIAHLKFAAKRMSPLELQYLIRLVMKDLRINAGVKHILDGLHSCAYEAFQNCRDLAEIVDRTKRGQLGDIAITMEVGIRLGTPVLPMLAEPCKSVDQAMKRCVNGMFAEIKYDGERVQVHKVGTSFSYYSRSLKPVQHHKISHLEKVIPQAFPAGIDLIIDAEVLLVDNATGKPLPFGSLGIHKKEQFKDASVCIFIFDILRYNEEDLMSKTLAERKALLESKMTEVQNRVMMSNYQLIRHGDHAMLRTMIFKAIDEGLEGLVLKDTASVYEPGKRHWLKVKKDYLEEGVMADTADLIVLGAYFGTGSKVKSDLTNVKVDDETPLYVKEGMDHGNIEKLAEEEAAANAGPESSTKKERKRSAEDDIEEKEVKKAKKEKVEDKDEEEAKCPPGKKACKYGADCYRKNKEHKEEFWHPPKK
ncbi:ATP-dependent DNA ligase domain protein [Oesophagostomum dentatum]|uniref:DNA ligase n=1 Tax=Oesophagostomum dentatum TaxID=61180 RepID=A0A0B1TF02_OESDE|nr:ATP-dependent DNA ligase domain protein [Oesophagostomum dentatum]